MNSSWVAKWRGVRVFVLGDVMLDKFVYGRVERISPEAPIPVLHHQSEEVMLGGAANVARNIIALGGEVLLVGALGDDEAGDLIAGPLIAEARIEGRFVREAHHPTTTKVRYVSGGQQIMRLDIERPFSLDAQKIQAICDWLAGAADSVSAIVLSDYAKGVLVPALIRAGRRNREGAAHSCRCRSEIARRFTLRGRHGSDAQRLRGRDDGRN